MTVGPMNIPSRVPEHPLVSCQLAMPYYDLQGVAYNANEYGEGRFFGTLYPYPGL